MFAAVDTVSTLEQLQHVQQLAKKYFEEFGDVSPTPSFAACAEALSNYMVDRAVSMKCQVLDEDGHVLNPKTEQDRHVTSIGLK